MTIAALFNRKVHTTLDVAGIEGGKKPAEALILESARALLAAKEDVPATLHEVDGGFVVQGHKAAVLFADTGDVEFKDLPESKTKPDAKTKPAAKAPAVASATAFEAGAFRKLGEANKTIGFLLKKNIDEAGWPALFETYVKGDADMEAAYAKFVVVEAAAKTGEKFDLLRDGKLVTTGTEPELLAWLHKEHSFSMSHAIAHEGYSVRAAKAAKATKKVEAVEDDKSAPGSAILAIKRAVQSSHDRIQAAMHEGLLTEAQLDEYMQVAPLVPYEKPLKADDARISIGGGSIYLSQDDFFAKVPHYAVAEYLLCLAVKEAIEGGSLDAFVKAIRSSLASSAKVKALDVELAESEGGGATKKLTEATLTEETPETVVIVVSDEAVELRANDETGAILATAAYNEADEGSLAKAHAEVLSTASDLGYDTDASEAVNGKNALADVQNELADLEKKWKGGKPPKAVLDKMTALRFERDRIANKADASEAVKGKKKPSTGTSYGSAQNNGGDDDGDGQDDEEDKVEETGDAAAVAAKKKSTYPNTGLSTQSRGSTGMASHDDGAELDADNYYEAEEALVGAVLAETTLLTNAEYLAIAKAMDARDATAVVEAFKAVTHPSLKPIAEGFASRTHVRGRKPSGKTIPHKGKHLKLKRKALTIKLPVDVGPGAGKGGAGGSVSETWIEDVRRMSVTEFASAMLEAAATDTAEVFALRVTKLTEGYAAGVGQKDIARKITAVNPIIKKRLGRGLDLESVSKTSQTVETVMVAIPHSILDEVLVRMAKEGIPADAEVRVIGESVHVRIPRTVADKLTAAFPLAKLA